MKIREIMEDASSGSSGTGSVAVVVQPMGMQTRSGGSMLSGKYTTDLTPNTPKEYKRNKHARGQFKNTPCN
jgi:hypothetical protein